MEVSGWPPFNPAQLFAGLVGEPSAQPARTEDQPDDAAALGLIDGGRARIVTAAGAAETAVEITDVMLPGHISLPNGQGVDYPNVDGELTLTGVPTNELTSLDWRDPLAGTPWHKHVPARVEALD